MAAQDISEEHRVNRPLLLQGRHSPRQVLQLISLLHLDIQLDMLTHVKRCKID